MKTILLAITITLLSTCTFAQNWTDSLAQDLVKLYPTTKLPGIAVAMVNADQVLFQQGLGHADIATNRPFEPTTILNIGSISKTFIGIALMQLVNEGKLDLDTDINKFLPFPIRNPRFPDTPITIRHLATHTSGIADTKNYGDKCYALVDPMPTDLKAIPKEDRKELKNIRNNKLRPVEDLLKDYLIPGGDLYLKKNFNKHTPGTHYEYTNVGATLAALVFEKVAGQDYRAYTSQHIFAPLGMTSTGWRFEDIDMAQHTTSYYHGGATVPKYTLITFADGGVLSSCADLARYLQQMIQGHAGKSDFLSAAAFETMLGTQFKDEHGHSGIFWDISKTGRIGHNGGDPGIFTYIQFDPETHIGLVAVTNISAYKDAETLDGFRKIWITMLKYAQKM